jgi:CelD/BcsL family acetyltransferase involved in cellulose biosynthesis
MQLRSTIYTEETVFTKLEAEWLDLLGRSVTNYVFQSPQFQAAWWQTLGEGELQIVAIRTEEDQLVGLAPLYVQSDDDGNKTVCFVGCVNVSDYLDILVDPAYQQEVYACLATVLKNQLKRDALFLCSLPEASPTRNWLKATFSQASETQQDVSPSIELPASWDQYLESIDRKQRHEIQRKMRRVEEVEHTFETITTEEDAQQSLPDFIRLHKASSSEKRDFWDENHLTFFNIFVPAAGAAGWLKLFFLKIGEVRAAAMLVFDYNNQYLLYNSGFDPNQFKNLSTGNVLTAYTIQKSIEENKSVYDFLRGNEEYKFRFGAESKPVYDISVKK